MTQYGHLNLLLHFSDAYLGTGNIAHPRYGGSGHVVCIEVLSLKGTKTWEEFSRAVGKEWMELGGVPHLAKQYDHLPDIFKYIRQVRIKKKWNKLHFEN